MLKRCADGGDERADFFPRQNGDVVLRKINARLKQRDQLHQFLFDRLKAPGDAPSAAEQPL